MFIGEGDISNIPPSTREFIGRRIEYFIKKDRSVGDNGFVYGYISSQKDEKSIMNFLSKTEIGKIMQSKSIDEILNEDFYEE